MVYSAHPPYEILQNKLMDLSLIHIYKGWGTAEPAYWPKGVELQARLTQVSEKLDQIFAL